jgi:hypothetical protein
MVTVRMLPSSLVTVVWTLVVSGGSVVSSLEEGVVIEVEEEVVVVDVSVVDVSTVVCTFSVSVTLAVAFVVGDVI